MGNEDVIYQVEGQAGWIRINRPDALNALTPSVVESIRDALDEAESDEEVRSVVVTGTGRAFCAGADLKAIGELSDHGGAAAMASFLRKAGTVFNRLESFPKPVIAGVNGLALAGGLELVLCCDLVIAAASARLGDAHANYGLLPGGGSSIRLPRKIGPTWAKYLLFTGEFLPAQDFVPMGLVNRVVPDDELESAIQQLVETLSSKSPLGLRRMKELVDDGLEQPLSTGLRLELLAVEAHAHSEDILEGLAAFRDKRPPKFTGR